MFCAFRSRIYNTDIKIFRKLKHNSRSQEISWPLRCSAVQCRAEQNRDRESLGNIEQCIQLQMLQDNGLATANVRMAITMVLCAISFHS